MRTSVSLAALLCLFAGAGTTPTQAGSSYTCHSCVPTFITIVTKSGGHDVPFPSRNGDMIGHFDSVGVPQSIVTPADSGAELVEVPCPPTMKKFYNYGS